MKKICMLLLIAAMLAVGAFVLTGCGSWETENSPIVGTWGWDQLGDWRYVFNPDGTGHRGEGFGADFFEFTWDANDSRLRINLIGDLPANAIRNEQWNFVIDGNRLTIDSRQDRSIVWSYIRQ